MGARKQEVAAGRTVAVEDVEGVEDHGDVRAGSGAETAAARPDANWEY